MLNCNYMMSHLKDLYDIAFDTGCMHEFVMTLENLKKEKGVTAMDIAKALLDNGIHPPTMYFPLIVEEALMVEPTETETRETLDHAIEVFRQHLHPGAGTPGTDARASAAHPGPPPGRSWRGAQSKTALHLLNHSVFPGGIL